MTFWHTMFTLAGTHTLNTTHTHSREGHPTHCRPRPLEGLHCGPAHVCVFLLYFALVCQFVCATLSGSYQDKAQPAAQGCGGYVGEGEGGAGKAVEYYPAFTFILFPSVLI